MRFRDAHAGGTTLPMIPSLPCIFAHPLPEVRDSLNPPQMFSGGVSPVVIVYYWATMWAYYTNGQLAWTINGLGGGHLIDGWTSSKDSIYVLLGDILCQYPASAFPLHQSEVFKPVTAVRISAGGLTSWSYDDPDADAALARLFATSPNPVSGPVYDASRDRIHVVADDGSMYSFRTDLDASVGNYELTKTHFAPDSFSPIYLEPVASGEPRVCWLSGGQVAVAETGELETPVEGMLAWTWQCTRAFTDQPSHSFFSWTAPVMVSQVPYKGGLGSLVIGSTEQWSYPVRQWFCTLLAPACFPVGLPYVKSFPPPEIQYEFGGVLGLPDGTPVTSVVERPYISLEGEELFVYAILQTGAKAFTFAKYRMTPIGLPGWTAEWWNSLKQQIDEQNSGYEQLYQFDLSKAESQNPNAPSYEVTRRFIDIAQYGPPPADIQWGGSSWLFPLLGTFDYRPPALFDIDLTRQPEDVAPAVDLLPISGRPIVVTVTTVKVPRPH